MFIEMKMFQIKIVGPNAIYISGREKGRFCS
jgi:hypothetical protein